jgi:hypothetical protein
MNKKEREEVLESYEALKNELSEQTFKARKLGYKCSTPKMPKNINDISHLNSTLAGFIKRFANWKLNLKKFEESKMYEVNV